ncbi:MAG TPA: hypothetical protein VFE38_02600 [Edaphobacter sp.]|nr:hypothetical protein [Edaphobacter sp.]
MTGLLIAASCSIPAQLAHAPTLDDILSRLENNRNRYIAEVPSFFCSEHVVSSLVYGKKNQSTITDSIFRLTRASNADQTASLVESREVQDVNGSPMKGKHINGPAILNGVFSGGLDTVSLSQKACMSYALDPVKPEHPDGPYIVEFATLPVSRRPSNCVLKEDGMGQVFIDPATMQVTRMEFMVPHHVILPAVVGVWRVSIDYAPVQLGGQTFWMPTTITSTAKPDDVDDPAVWRFKAGYSKYHKLEVTSHILSSGRSSAP